MSTLHKKVEPNSLKIYTFLTQKTKNCLAEARKIDHVLPSYKRNNNTMLTRVICETHLLTSETYE